MEATSLTRYTLPLANVPEEILSISQKNEISSSYKGTKFIFTNNKTHDALIITGLALFAISVVVTTAALIATGGGGVVGGILVCAVFGTGAFYSLGSLCYFDFFWENH